MGVRELVKQVLALAGLGAAHGARTAAYPASITFYVSGPDREERPR